MYQVRPSNLSHDLYIRYSRHTIITTFHRIFFCRLSSSMIHSKRKSFITYCDRQVKIARSTWTSVCRSPVKMAALASIESTDTYVTARKTSWTKIASGSTMLARQILATTTGTARWYRDLGVNLSASVHVVSKGKLATWTWTIVSTWYAPMGRFASTVSPVTSANVARVTGIPIALLSSTIARQCLVTAARA